jgi:hypothetical protein
MFSMYWEPGVPRLPTSKYGFFSRRSLQLMSSKLKFSITSNEIGAALASMHASTLRVSSGPMKMPGMSVARCSKSS